jgi:hypothetical protein
MPTSKYHNIQILAEKDLKTLVESINAEVVKKESENFRLVSTATQFFCIKDEFIILTVFSKNSQTSQPE